MVCNFFFKLTPKQFKLLESHLYLRFDFLTLNSISYKTNHLRIEFAPIGRTYFCTDTNLKPKSVDSIRNEQLSDYINGFLTGLSFYKR